MSRFERSVEYILILLLALMTVITSYQILGRYLLQKTPYWSEQSVLLLLNYLVFIGIPVLLWRRQHIGFDFFVEKLPTPFKAPIALLRGILLLLFGGIMCFYSMSLLLKVKEHQIATLSVSQSITYVPSFLCGLAIALIALLGIKKSLWKS